MVSNVIERLQKLRTNIDSTFESWCTEILALADTIGIAESVPRKTRIQRNRSNTPSTSPKEHYKRVVAIPLFDFLISQLNTHFKGDSRHTQTLFLPHNISDSF